MPGSSASFQHVFNRYRVIADLILQFLEEEHQVHLAQGAGPRINPGVHVNPAVNLGLTCFELYESVLMHKKFLSQNYCSNWLSRAMGLSQSCYSDEPTFTRHFPQRISPAGALTSLSLNTRNFQSRHPSSLFFNLPHLTNLRQIDVWSGMSLYDEVNPPVPYPWMQFLTSSIKASPVSALSLLFIPPPDAILILEVCKDYSNLREIDMGCVPDSEAEILRLTRLIAQHTMLQKLTMPYSLLRRSTLPFLQRLFQLEELVLTRDIYSASDPPMDVLWPTIEDGAGLDLPKLRKLHVDAPSVYFPFLSLATDRLETLEIRFALKEEVSPVEPVGEVSSSEIQYGHESYRMAIAAMASAFPNVTALRLDVPFFTRQLVYGLFGLDKLVRVDIIVNKERLSFEALSFAREQWHGCDWICGSN